MLTSPGKLPAFVPFLQRQQATVNTWVPLATEIEASFPGVIYYELPTINEMPMLSRTFVNEGMRGRHPRPEIAERTITLYIDTAEFMQATDIPDKNDVHTLLVDRNGEILWRATGNFTKEKGTGAARRYSGKSIARLRTTPSLAPVPLTEIRVRYWGEKARGADRARPFFVS